MGGYPFQGGATAEVRAWDHARTAAEIKKDMHCRLSGDERGLTGYWPFGTIVRALKKILSQKCMVLIWGIGYIDKH